MGGTLCRDFSTDTVTHLVAGGTDNPKYAAAVDSTASIVSMYVHCEALLCGLVVLI